MPVRLLSLPSSTVPQLQHQWPQQKPIVAPVLAASSSPSTSVCTTSTKTKKSSVCTAKDPNVTCSGRGRDRQCTTNLPSGGSTAISDPVSTGAAGPGVPASPSESASAAPSLSGSDPATIAPSPSADTSGPAISLSTSASFSTVSGAIPQESSSAPSASSSTPGPRSSGGFSTNPQIQVDRVHATGNKGAGIKIGVVDSGVDYHRAPLGGCFGPGCKIAGGYDFVGDSFTGTNTPQPDADPFDNCFGHGSFVAGVLGANENEYGVTGVAPEATQYHYRAFSCGGQTSDDVVLQAMQAAYNEGVDVLNLSLGARSAWSSDAISVMAQRIAAKGIAVVGSAGNSGFVGAFYPFAPATGLGVIGAGSVDNAIYPAQQATVSTGYGPLVYYDWQAFSTNTLFTPTPTVGIAAFTTDPNVPNDGCILPSTIPDFSGRIAVIRRGGCALEDKAFNAFQAGAAGVFVVNTPNTPYVYYEFPIDFALISSQDGQYLLDQIAQGNDNLTITFSFDPAPQPNVFTGNITSEFSCIGPTNDLLMGASVLAPGTNIVSVLPAALGSWGIQDGTSFSSPAVAGGAALYLNARRSDPNTIREAFQATADVLPTALGATDLATVAAQGAGKLQLFDALNSDTIVGPTELLLNDTAYFNNVQYIEITNTGRQRRQYSLAHLASGTAPAFFPGSNQSYNSPIPQSPNAAGVRFSPPTFNLGAGRSTRVKITFTQPGGLNAAQFPIYSGFIQITGGAQTVQVPYLGVAAAMKNLPIIDGSTQYLPFVAPTILDGTQNPQNGTKQYSFNGTDFPTVLYRFTGGTPRVYIDLVNPNTNLGFAPQYISKRWLFPLHQGPGQAAPPKGFLLNAWCKLTHNKGIGCKGNGGGQTPQNSFAAVPIVGTVFQDDFVPRK